MNEDKLIKIKDEVNRMDDTFWNDFVVSLTEAEKEFKSNPTPENEVEVELKKIAFDMASVRYEGYKEIIENPLRSAIITRNVKESIEKLEKERSRWQKML